MQHERRHDGLGDSSMTWQHAACVFHRAAAAVVNFFMIIFVASTRFEGTSEYDNTEILLFTAVLVIYTSRGQGTKIA